ncbi:MAG: hypothetical protein VX379_09475 [Pseudomonadota bacterium]|nr:hypothetical protein [Pseudomonadota bacterium]MEE3319801.1 hypothetical protein [Pseudomonadota bacterium]
MDQNIYDNEHDVMMEMMERARVISSELNKNEGLAKYLVILDDKMQLMLEAGECGVSGSASRRWTILVYEAISRDKPKSGLYLRLERDEKTKEALRKLTSYALELALKKYGIN